MNIQFLVFISIVQGIILATHFVVYKGLLKGFVIQDPHMIIALRILFIILAISFIAVQFTFRNALSPLGNTLYYLASVWLGTLWWLFLASIMIIISYVVIYYMGGANLLPHTINLLRGISTIYVIIALCVSTYGLINAEYIAEVEYEIDIPQVPPAWKGKTIAFIADTHFGQIHTESHAYDVLSLFRKRDVAAIFIGGDFYDGPRMDFASVAKPFGTFISKYGTFFVTGNHETYQDEPYVQALQEHGVKVLTDEFVNLDGLILIGLEYTSLQGKERTQKTGFTLQSIVSRLSPAEINLPKIVLKHVPNDVDVIESSNIDLMLSGHTHRGQVWPFSLLAKLIYKGYEYGHVQSPQGMHVITTSGAGTWGPPQRIGTSREVVYITFK